MIVTCEKCGTKYRLDESRIQKDEFRVRCQKCDHAFTVAKPGVVEEAPLLLEPESDAVSEQSQTRCRTITICNQKGGVAKTSTCLNLGASLALMKKRVLLIDFDVQSNLSILLGQHNAKSFFDVLHSDTDAISKCIVNTKQNLWLLPSNSKMALLSKKYLKEENFEYLLHEKLNEIKLHFDYVLIDTPPSGDFYTLNSLLTSELAIIPTQCEYLSMNGVGHIEDMIRVVREKTDHHIDYRILITMYNQANTASRAIYNNMRKKYAGRMLNNLIEYDAKMQESQIVHRPVIYYDKNSKAGRQYLSLAKEITDLHM